MIMSRGLYFNEVGRVNELYQGTLLEAHLKAKHVPMPVLCPMMDLANHSEIPNSGCTASTPDTLQKFSQYFNLPGDQQYFMLATMTDLKSGVEVMTKYNAQNAREFEFMYGFLPGNVLTRG
jgi:hypothetical protein